MAVDLRTRLAHVELPNPILTASGCAGAGRELAQFFDVAKIGARIVDKIGRLLARRDGDAVDDEPDALDIEGLIAAAADDPQFAEIVAETVARVAEKLPRDLTAALAADDGEANAARAALARDFLLGERA